MSPHLYFFYIIWIFITDSSFNKKNEIETDFNMNNFIKTLEGAL